MYFFVFIFIRLFAFNKQVVVGSHRHNYYLHTFSPQCISTFFTFYYTLGTLLSHGDNGNSWKLAPTRINPEKHVDFPLTSKRCTYMPRTTIACRVQ